MILLDIDSLLLLKERVINILTKLSSGLSWSFDELESSQSKINSSGECSKCSFSAKWEGSICSRNQKFRKQSWCYNDNGRTQRRGHFSITEWETSTHRSTHLYLHWLILVCALRGIWTHDFGVSRWWSNQLSYLGRATVPHEGPEESH